MEMQSTIHDHHSQELPSVFNYQDLQKLEQAFITPQRERDGPLGEWLRLRNLVIFKLSYHLSLRPKEALCIKFVDIDRTSNLIRISPESNKLRKGRTLPIPHTLQPLLIRYLSLSRLQYWKFSPYLFPSSQNTRLSTDRWQEIFRDTQAQAGIYHGPRKRTPYTLRHTKATLIYEKTHDPLLVANILGHKTLESTKVYIHLAELKPAYIERMRTALT